MEIKIIFEGRGYWNTVEREKIQTSINITEEMTGDRIWDSCVYFIPVLAKRNA